ncbi:hypothetical protein ACJVC5_00720 [Peredibacter sp. HCB2-198]|uniref:hypothetical protein n=1 Tax=Peredibacter sp. HCB2-198 TaxID=3383025 RepID=UPI0038B5E746
MSYLEDSSKNGDPVRPGEQWFFYWKTSAALWESRILQFPPHEVVFIPLYWGFHAESASDWDFGRIQPERDILRLTQLLTHHGRKFCWILPLTPAPFLPNGGVPVTAARVMSINTDGVHLAVLDQELKLNKMYSFFEPKVFQSFASFVKAFGSFLASSKIKAPVWGAQFSYHQDGKNLSFMEDRSLAFEQGFSRYLKKANPNGNDLTETKREAQLKDIFTEEVSALFKTTAEAGLSPFWGGSQSIVVLGAGPKETIERSFDGGKSQLEYTRDLFNHYVNHQWISSALLTQKEKKDSLERILGEHFGSREIAERYNYESYSAELTEEFRPFGVISLFGGRTGEEFQRLGLTSFLDKHFRWLYQRHDELEFTPEWIDVHHDKIKFFHGRDLDRTKFSQILKLFLMGQRILLDLEGLHPDLDKRLQIFLLENNLKMQSVNYLTTTNIVELGEGRFITFEGEKLLSEPQKEKFWQHIFRYLNLVQPELQMDEDVFSLWRIRGTTPHELSYLDVRRVNFYNPTSYKKIVSIKTHKHFAFMRMIDPIKAQAKSTPDGVDVELLPNGKIALDFGHYEEA